MDGQVAGCQAEQCLCRNLAQEVAAGVILRFDGVHGWSGRRSSLRARDLTSWRWLGPFPFLGLPPSSAALSTYEEFLGLQAVVATTGGANSTYLTRVRRIAVAL
jgi:hypothetical protein